jgi:hypothetical protein
MLRIFCTELHKLIFPIQKYQAGVFGVWQELHQQKHRHRRMVPKWCRPVNIAVV